MSICKFYSTASELGGGGGSQSGHWLGRKTIQNKYNSDVSDRIDNLAPPTRLELVKNVLKFHTHLADWLVAFRNVILINRINSLRPEIIMIIL